MTEEEHRKYLLEDTIVSIEAQMEQIRRKITSAALQGGMTAETCVQTEQLFDDCKRRLGRMPIRRR